MFKQQSIGFTLIEMLIAVSIMMLVFGGGIAGYTTFNDRQIVVSAVEDLKQHLNFARSKALSGDLGGCSTLSGYRVMTQVAGESMLLNISPDCGGSFGNAKTYTFPPKLTITDLNMIYKTPPGGVVNLPAGGDIRILYAGREYGFEISQSGEMSEGDWVN